MDLGEEYPKTKNLVADNRNVGHFCGGFWVGLEDVTNNARRAIE